MKFGHIARIAGTNEEFITVSVLLGNGFYVGQPAFAVTFWNMYVLTMRSYYTKRFVYIYLIFFMQAVHISKCLIYGNRDLGHFLDRASRRLCGSFYVWVN